MHDTTGPRGGLRAPCALILSGRASSGKGTPQGFTKLSPRRPVPSTATATRTTIAPTGPNRPKGATMKSISARRFLAIERSFHGYRTKPAVAPRIPDSHCEPERAQVVLQALARAFRPGDALSPADIARAAGIRPPRTFPVYSPAQPPGGAT
jgi:hypothetical protein